MRAERVFKFDSCILTKERKSVIIEYGVSLFISFQFTIDVDVGVVMCLVCV